MDEIRNIQRADVSALKKVLDSSALFPSEYLDDMISDYFENPKSEAIWFTKDFNGIPISLGYCAPEQMTGGTYNLYAIAVSKAHQGKGIGSAMMTYIENRLKTDKHRLLIVETSTDPALELTRSFYLKNKYTEEARIRDFWKEGEGKVIYWKKL